MPRKSSRRPCALESKKVSFLNNRTTQCLLPSFPSRHSWLSRRITDLGTSLLLPHVHYICYFLSPYEERLTTSRKLLVCKVGGPNTSKLFLYYPDNFHLRPAIQFLVYTMELHVFVSKSVVSLSFFLSLAFLDFLSLLSFLT